MGNKEKIAAFVSLYCLIVVSLLSVGLMSVDAQKTQADPAVFSANSAASQIHMQDRSGSLPTSPPSPAPQVTPTAAPTVAAQQATPTAEPQATPTAAPTAAPSPVAMTAVPTVDAPKATSIAAATAAPTPAGTLVDSPDSSPTVHINPSPATEQASDDSAADQPFWGISQQITSQWIFPLQIETHTPVQGQFGASRSNGRAHAGIDLYAPNGTDVFAMASGRVRSIYLFYEDLLAFEVENDDGTLIRYTELDPLVKTGERVEQGQLIAQLRKNSSGSCMLHLEIYATCSGQPTTQTDNRSNYLYVSHTSSFMRRSDLVDPSAVYSLPRQ